MKDEKDFGEDIRSVRSDMERLEKTISEFPELRSIITGLKKLKEESPLAEDLEECKKRVIGLLDRIKRLLEEVESPHSKAKIFPAHVNTNAFSLSTLAGELNAQIEWLRSTLEYIERWGRTGPYWYKEEVADPTRVALQKVKSYLVPLLKLFVSKIWQIISHVQTPVEWKLTGKVGTSVLGLADVGIEITLGRQAVLRVIVGSMQCVATWRPVWKRKFVPTTDNRHNLPVAENLLDRKFEVTLPNHALDIGYYLCAHAAGWLYLAQSWIFPARSSAGVMGHFQTAYKNQQQASSTETPVTSTLAAPNVTDRKKIEARWFNHNLIASHHRTSAC